MTNERRIFEARKRAAPTGTAFDFIRIKIRCSQCSKEGLHPLAELEVNQDAICPYCGNVIDLSADSDRAEIRKRAQEYKQIKPL